MKNIKTLTIDIDKDNYETIPSVQYDSKTRYLHVYLFNSSSPFDITGCSVKIAGIKADNTDIFNECKVIDPKKGFIEIELTEQMNAVHGLLECELKIYSADGVLTTKPLNIYVSKSVTRVSNITSSNEFTALTEALAKAQAIDSKADKTELEKLSSQLDKSVKFKVVGEGTTVPPIIGGGSYILPIATKTTLGGVKIGANLSIDSNGVLSAINNSNGANITISNTLDNYSGATLNDKMVAMFNDINTNHKNTPMIITLPDGVIEITSDLRAIGWTNKIFIGNTYLYYKNCNAIEFIQCMHNKIYIHASSSSNLDIANGNILGLINPSATASLTKRGYKITDCSYNEFKFNNIIGFTNGIEVYSEYGDKGTFYNNIYFTSIWRCQRPVIFRTGKASDDTSSQSGWITEIILHGGMFDCDDGILVGQEVASRPVNEPSDNYQGLKFYNIGIEHIRKKENGIGIYFLQGKNNAIINPRFEGSLLTGNSTSGAYILVKESGYACNNRIETSSYPINVDRVQLNYSAKQLANPNYDNPAGSYIEGDLYDNNGFKCGYKAIATPGKMVYEAKNLSNYYLNNAKTNTFNYTYSDTEFAKVKCSDGTIKSIGYTS